MNRTIDNTQDILDSRDIIARIEELESELMDARDHYGVLWDEDDEKQSQCSRDQYVADSMAEYHADEIAELASLKHLAEQAESSSDWIYGEALIRESYFTDYARDLAEDIGAIDENATWPHTFIDWDAAAEALKQDYTSVDFDGVEYLIRS